MVLCLGLGSLPRPQLSQSRGDVGEVLVVARCKVQRYPLSVVVSEGAPVLHRSQVKNPWGEEVEPVGSRGARKWNLEFDLSRFYIRDKKQIESRPSTVGCPLSKRLFGGFRLSKALSNRALVSPT